MDKTNESNKYFDFCNYNSNNKQENAFPCKVPIKSFLAGGNSYLVHSCGRLDKQQAMQQEQDKTKLNKSCETLFKQLFAHSYRLAVFEQKNKE